MKLELSDWNKDFDHTKIITSHIIFQKKNTVVKLDGGEEAVQKKFNDHSIFSPKIFGDLDAEAEYSCACGHLVGRFYEDTVCDRCETPVRFNGLSVDRFGWIDLSLNVYNEDGDVVVEGKGIKIIKYVAYQFLEKLIGQENLKKIIETKNILDINGEIDNKALEELRSEHPKMKYWYYGISKFYKHYNEILDYYYDLNQRKDEDTYNYLKYKDLVFIDKIPIISPIMRPVRRTSDGLQLSGINIHYQNILKELQIIADPNTIDIVRDAFIEQIQADYFQLCVDSITAIQGKEGLIKEHMCGTRINFSARNIIAPPESHIKMNEVALPYLTFLELWRFELINILSNMEGISLPEADNILYKASIEFNEKIWSLMNYICKNEEIYILFNRNPSINYGSVLCLRVVEVKKNINDVTATASNLICPLLNSDYDGDVLNIVSLKDKELVETFKAVFSPENLLISSNDGMFNEQLNLDRDFLMALTEMLMKPKK